MIPPYEPIKTDTTGTIWINFSNQFQQIEYSDPLPNLQGKTVIVGGHKASRRFRHPPENPSLAQPYACTSVVPELRVTGL